MLDEFDIFHVKKIQIEINFKTYFLCVFFEGNAQFLFWHTTPSKKKITFYIVWLTNKGRSFLDLQILRWQNPHPNSQQGAVGVMVIIQDSHSWDPGSIPGRRKKLCFLRDWQVKREVHKKTTTASRHFYTWNKDEVVFSNKS